MGMAEKRCLSLSARQHGAISRAQAVTLGLSEDAVDRLVASGRWIRALPAIYRVSGGPRSWLQSLSIAALWAGPGAAISHRAAAALWTMEGFPQRGVELSAPFPLRCGAKGLKAHCAPNLERGDLRWFSGIPVTTPERTLLDLGAVIDRPRLEEVPEFCLRRGWVSTERLEDRIARIGTNRRRGVAALHAILSRRTTGSPPTGSIFETRLLAAFRKARLPDPLRQYEVHDRGRLIARLDFAFPSQRVGIEADGADHHLRPARWDRDHARRNALIAAGWVCLVVTWKHLHREPERLVDELRAVLEARGLPRNSRQGTFPVGGPRQICKSAAKGAAE